MDYKFSKHAEERIAQRGLSKDLVREVVNQPDCIITLDSKLLIYQRAVRQNEKEYLYRVFVNPEMDPNLIVTVYRTSKLEKYENQI
jgi:hypothetical protein